ncbi:MAG: hypothetical protein H6625_02470 [Bdellovibrionaceae bacterium]|nr:hypothetical protein [Pseudobdellovibrionaceae bacterium]
MFKNIWISLVLIIITLPNITSAQVINPKMELEAICKVSSKNLKGLKTEKMKTEYCTCWVENISSVEEKFQKIIIDVYQDKMSYETFSDDHNPIAIFEIRVVEKCLKDAKWRKPQSIKE